jgi:hypothetical protein
MTNKTRQYEKQVADRDCAKCAFIGNVSGEVVCRCNPPSMFPMTRKSPLGAPEMGFISLFPLCPIDHKGCGRFTPADWQPSILAKVT